MALRNDGSVKYDPCTGEELKSSVDLFKEAERRLTEKRTLIADLENEYRLLEEQFFNTYKKNVQYDLTFITKWFDDAIDWLNMLNEQKDKDGNKLDKRKKYAEKESFDFVKHEIEKIIGRDDINITSIMPYEYEKCAYWIRFDCCGLHWQLTIPVIKNISFFTYKREKSSCFYLTLHYGESEHFWDFVGKTFIEDEMKEIMKYGIEKQKGLNDD